MHKIHQEYAQYYSLLTKFLSGKAIGNLRQVKKLHSDATSHKGKEIINVLLGVLKKNKSWEPSVLPVTSSQRTALPIVRALPFLTNSPNVEDC